MALTTLAHHIDVEWLAEAYRKTRKSAAPGVDGVTAEGTSRTWTNLSSLLDGFKSGEYRAPAVRRVYIEKPGQRFKRRPIGIPTLEDKVLQRAVLRPWNRFTNRTFWTARMVSALNEERMMPFAGYGRD